MKSWFINEKKEIPIKVQLFNFVLVTSVVIGVFYYSLLKIGISLDLSFVDTFKVRLVDGFVLTLQISIVSLILSLLIGIGAALLQSSKILALRYFASGYVKLIRGTPLIVQIYLFYYVIGTAWGVDDRFIAGVLILSIFEGAYIAEIIRGSYLSLDKTQLESSKAVGFTPRQTFRFVIFPQMVARTLPALTGQFASIIKDSSLLSMIAVIEIAQTIREITALQLNIFDGYLVLGLLYLAITLPISYIGKVLERHYSYEN